MTSYFEFLSQDLDALGLQEYIPQPESYTELSNSLRDIGESLGQMQPLPRVPSVKARTVLGASIMNMSTRDTRFEEVEGYACCSQTEPSLLASLAECDSPRRYPIIVLNEATPIGVIKRMGDPTCYGLVSQPEFGIVAGIVSAAKAHDAFNPYRPESNHAWTVDVTDIDRLYPVRPTLFSIPVAERRGLPLVTKWQKRSVLMATHRAIVSRVRELMHTAVPIEIGR
jgi:hypothetical protein